MKKIFLLLCLIQSVSFAISASELIEQHTSQIKKQTINSLINLVEAYQNYIESYRPSDDTIKSTLMQQAPTLKSEVIQHVFRAIKCADQYNVDHKNILTIIDYSLPSNQKRLWVFDLKNEKLLFHTYVSHGITSGALMSEAFSNRYNSKASSIGVYTTEKSYVGREGTSLRLDGLESGFNDNAQNRSVVMHGGWYVEEAFIKKYGRAGRSWGCPALPLGEASTVINAIKDKTLFVVYYPSDDWMQKSKFLQCEKPATMPKTLLTIKTPRLDERDDILFVDTNHNRVFNENKPVIVVSADTYARMFHTEVPLNRMLRRQINHMEYVALNSDELKKVIDTQQNELNNLSFVIPQIVMSHGYYETLMKRVEMGKIKEVIANTDHYIVHFESRPDVLLSRTNQFIRWVGL